MTKLLRIVDSIFRCATVVFIIIGSFVVGFLSVSYPTLKAQVPIGYPYGGQILLEIMCLCSGNSLLREIGPPRPGGIVLYPIPGPAPTATSYMYYMHMLPGVWVTGYSVPGGVCLIPSPTGCIQAPLPVTHTAFQEGTGLVPGAMGI